MSHKKFRLLLRNESTERSYIIQHEAKMFSTLIAYFQKCVEYDNINEFDTDEDRSISDDDGFDIWSDMINTMISIYYFEYKKKKSQVNDQINKLRKELDEHYGEHPEEGSPASLCKITEFGYGRSDELRSLYAWKDNQIKTIRHIQRLVGEYREMS